MRRTPSVSIAGSSGCGAFECGEGEASTTPAAPSALALPTSLIMAAVSVSLSDRGSSDDSPFCDTRRTASLAACCCCFSVPSAAGALFRGVVDRSSSSVCRWLRRLGVVAADVGAAAPV